MTNCISNVGTLCVISFTLFFEASALLLAFGEWEPTGFPSGGRIRLMADDDQAIALVRRESEDYLFSTDSGITWNSLPRPTGRTVFSSLIVDPTGVLFFSQRGHIRRVFVDKPEWQTIPVPAKADRALGIAQYSKDDSRLLAAVYDYGFILSSDHGESWAIDIQFPDSLVRFQSFVFTENGDLLAGDARARIHRYHADKQTWSSDTLLADIGEDSTFRVERIIPTGEGLTLAEVVPSVKEHGRVRLLQAKLFRQLADNPAWLELQESSVSINSIQASPSGPLFAFGEAGLYSAHSAAQLDWELMYRTSKKLHALSTIGDSVLLLAAGRTIVRSSDGGRSWEERPFPGGFLPTRQVVVDSRQRIFVTTTDGVFSSYDEGDSWQHRGFEASEGAHLVSDDRAGVYALAADSLWYSDNGGLTWQTKMPSLVIDGGIVDFASRNSVRCALESRHLDDGEIAVLHVSSDAGDSWMTRPMTLGDSPSQHRIFVGSDGDILASNGEERLIWSSDLGRTWTIRDAYDRRRDLLVLQGELLFDAEGAWYGNFAIYGKKWDCYVTTMPHRSTDKGQSWEAILHAEFSYSPMLVGSNNNLYFFSKWEQDELQLAVSDDQGNNWSFCGAELNTDELSTVLDMVEFADGRLFAVATDANYRSVGSVVSVPGADHPEPLSIALRPQPATNECHLEFDLAHDSHVELTIFNNRGQSLAKIIDGTRAAGRQTVTLSTSHLPAGQYFLQIAAGASKHTSVLQITR